MTATDKLRAWLLAYGGIPLVLAGAVVLLAGPVREKRLDHEVKALLLEVQEALQRYHVDEELYPARPMRGTDLVAMLQEREYLGEVANPWTGRAYGPGEADGEEDGDRGGEAKGDWLRYRTDEFAESYELTALVPGSDEVHLRLDSVENQSLE